MSKVAIALADFADHVVDKYGIDRADMTITVSEFYATRCAEVLDDEVNEPAHYKVLPIECIDLIRHCLTTEEYRGFCLANWLKYRYRAGAKENFKQDLAKSDKYLEFLSDLYLEEVEEDNG